MIMNKYWIGFSLILTLFSCKKLDDSSLNSENPFEFRKVEHFPEPHYNINENKPNEAGFLLGKKLFNDPLLSSDSTVSCETCHHQFGAFADPFHDVSHGVKSRLGVRNTPALQNLAWQTHFLWDGGVNHLDVFPLAPITNPLEMDEDLNNVIAKLNRSPEYKAMFKAAYGDDSIYTQRVFRALSQFMLLMISDKTPYDDYIKGNSNALSQEQKDGLLIFREKGCNSCHQEPLFTNNGFENTGLSNQTNDPGLFHVSQIPSDSGKFKVPSLRNVMITQPYMHDGKIGTIEEALEHYNSGVINHPNLSEKLKKNGKIGIELSNEEKQKLKAFLSALTDQNLISNPIFKQR